MKQLENTIDDYNPHVMARWISHLKSKSYRNGKCIEYFHKGMPNHGLITVMYKTKYYRIGSHRLAYLLKHGSINNFMHICHKCDNPKCVKPSHLFQGTAKENQQDSARKGRKRRGEQHPGAKITGNQVRAIRSLAGKIPQSQIAKKFKVSQPQISSIISKKTWSHL